MAAHHAPDAPGLVKTRARTGVMKPAPDRAADAIPPAAAALDAALDAEQIVLAAPAVLAVAPDAELVVPESAAAVRAALRPAGATDALGNVLPHAVLVARLVADLAAAVVMEPARTSTIPTEKGEI